MDLRRFHSHLLKGSKCGKYVFTISFPSFIFYLFLFLKFVVIFRYLLMDSEKFTEKPCR